MKNKGARNDTRSDHGGLKDDSVSTECGSRESRIIHASNDETGAVHRGVPGGLIERHGASEEGRKGEDGSAQVDNGHCRSDKCRGIAHIDAG